MENIFNKWRDGLKKTSKATFQQISTLLGSSEINDETFEDLESLMIQADLGIETSEAVLAALWQREESERLTRATQLRQAFHQELQALLSAPPDISFPAQPTVFLIVGVNGSGKTTTIAKLGQRFQQSGKQVLFGAADTYRAAAVDQLQIWAERLSIPIILGQPGGDAGAVAFDSVQSALNQKKDVLLIDTAGRLHTRFNLMEELKKVYRVVGKALPGAPHHVWLVMDATTGQNALSQAKAFKNAVNVSGVILAKLDSSARGGMAFAIQRELGLPIYFAGLGEKPDDLQPFDPDAFITGILGQQ